jgi:hypothetical protein
MNRFLLLALCLTLQACLPSSPSTRYLTEAANPAIKVRPPAVLDATAGTRAYTPAEPGDWEKINRAVTPAGGAK